MQFSSSHRVIFCLCQCSEGGGQISGPPRGDMLKMCACTKFGSVSVGESCTGTNSASVYITGYPSAELFGKGMAGCSSFGFILQSYGYLAQHSHHRNDQQNHCFAGKQE